MVEMHGWSKHETTDQEVGSSSLSGRANDFKHLLEVRIAFPGSFGVLGTTECQIARSGAQECAGMAYASYRDR